MKHPMNKILTLITLSIALTACGTKVQEAPTQSSQTDSIIPGPSNSNSANLQIVPGNTSISPGGSTPIAVTGGLPPYTYSVVPANIGKVSSNAFYANDVEGTAIITATDANGQPSSTTVFVKTNIVLAAKPNPVKAGELSELSAAGGYGEYTFSATGAEIEDGNQFRAPGTPGTYTVTVQDAHGKTKTLKIKVTTSNPLEISPSQTTARVDGTPVPFQITGGRAPYKTRVYSGDGSFTLYGEGNANFYPPTGAMAVKLMVTDADGEMVYANVTVQSSIVKQECNKIAAQSIGGRVEYGVTTSINSKQVCKIALPAVADGSVWKQSANDFKCPENWYPLTGPNGIYTISYSQVLTNFKSFWGSTETLVTPSHQAFASIDLKTECKDYCTGRNFWGDCKEWKNSCSLVRYLACVPDNTSPLFQ